MSYRYCSISIHRFHSVSVADTAIILPQGTQYWRYINTTMDRDYPMEISEGFTGIPDNIDAATVWTGNGKIYFYKGTKFWRFDPASKPPVRSNYPKRIQNWEGIPNHINAAVTYKGFTYFFQDNAYYRFNDRMFKASTMDFKLTFCHF